MITDDEFKKACNDKDMAEEIINKYWKQKKEQFENRLKSNPLFKDEELTYSATARCPCGSGLAYPKGCGSGHYWDCAAILKGIADETQTHTGRLPFVFYNVKSEDSAQHTTRNK